jgi:hypothetical protein
MFIGGLNWETTDGMVDARHNVTISDLFRFSSRLFLAIW